MSPAPDGSFGLDRPVGRTGWLRTGLRRLGVTVAVLLMAFVTGLLPVEMVRVESDSMVPTLQPGDQVVMLHGSSGLRRGDIVVVDDPEGSGSLVKRVVALGGDEMAIEDGVLVVNRVPVVEPFVDQTRIDGVYIGPLTVPADQLYVLGDNRGASVDSRYFGPVAQNTVIGQVTGRVWPTPGRL